MFNFSQNTHPLTRDGKSQGDRQNLRALSPDFAQPDNRDEKKLLAYLYEFAKAVIFIEEDKTQDNWQEFFRTGSSVQLALIAQFDAETLQKDFKDAQMRFADGLEVGNFYPLVDFIFETALTIDRWHQALSSDTEFIDGQLVINENPLRLTIQNLIQSNLQSALKQLIGVANSLSDFKIAPLSIQYQIVQDDLQKEAISDQIRHARYVLPDFKNETKILWAISPTDFFLRDAALQEAMNTPHSFQAVAMGRLTDLFSIFYKAVHEIVSGTEGVSILQPTQMHEPHLGLIYAFLKLFSFAQSDLNQMPQRHLDFYFRQVLGLKPRPFVPDEAHLIFDVNKSFPTAKIGEKALIKDGKDSLKAEIQFATADELVATQAQVATLRTLHYDNTTTLYAAPVANSADGNGAPFPPNTDTSWAALGSTETPKARVGLLMASPVLRLAEGARAVTLTITTKESIKTVVTDFSKIFDIELSGKKGWFKPNTPPTINIKGLELTLKFTLQPTDQAVVAANPSVLKADFGVTEPLMKLVLNLDSYSFYNIFKNATIEKVTLNTDVKGVTNFIVQNQNGLLDATKPFQPFGAQPKAGDTFYVGSDEAFRKKLTSLTFKLPLVGVSASLESYYRFYNDVPGIALPKKTDYNLDIQFIKEGAFSAKINKPLFDNTNDAIRFTNIDNDLLTNPSVLTQFLAGETQRGFVKWTLKGDFLHSRYAEVAEKRAKSIAAQNPPPADKSMPNLPLTPIIQSLTMDYEAEHDLGTAFQIFHLYPFEETNRVTITKGDSLLPKFETSETKVIQGALYVGLAAAHANETLSILFQLNEPSANPYSDSAKIEWSYLVDNQWHKLHDGEHILSDTTEGFIRSGIVQLVLPFTISSKNTTILPPQYLWLRAATDDHAEATCRVIGVHTQAVRAVFENKGNDLERLNVPLAASSLKKMVEPLGDIKSVAQPYDSFGGRAPETASAFYRRSSEHLRHKGRAITLNDYESLVLAAFPDIYKVKCITHTLAERVQVGAKDKLIAPGYVTVVVIPNLATQPLVERFEPKVSRGRLDDINDFLKKRIAPFVQLDVMNAIFEPIDTMSKITFVKGKSPAFYQNQLNLDLKRYFAPWAFDPTAKIEFGGQIFPSSILGFMEQRDYVNFVEDFKVTKSRDSNTTSEGKTDDEGVLTTETARGIFVSGKNEIILA